MSFDFDNLANLAATNPQAFEVERKRLIAEHMRTIPEERREKFQDLQNDIDSKRDTMTYQQFMKYLATRMQENLADLSDQSRALQVIFERDSDHKPVLQGINKIAYTDKKSN